jgi:ABC-type sugar transport system ATPase subunit
MTVAQNMAYGLRQRKIEDGEVKRRVGLAADMLDLTHLMDRRPKALSGGQRVAMGRAMVCEPKSLSVR